MLVSTTSPAKMLELIKMPFERGETRLGSVNHVLDGDMGTIWWIWLNDQKRHWCRLLVSLLLKVEQGLTSQQTHYRSYRGRVSLLYCYCCSMMLCWCWGCAMSGLIADSRTLIDKARVEAQVRVIGTLNLNSKFLILTFWLLIGSHVSDIILY